MAASQSAALLSNLAGRRHPAATNLQLSSGDALMSHRQQNGKDVVVLTQVLLRIAEMECVQFCGFSAIYELRTARVSKQSGGKWERGTWNVLTEDRRVEEAPGAVK